MDEKRLLEAPETLNGYAVIASAPRRGILQGSLGVICHRPGHHPPYIVGTWSPDCGDSWVWGHYYSGLIEAVGHFAHMTGQMSALKIEAEA